MSNTVPHVTMLSPQTETWRRIIYFALPINYSEAERSFHLLLKLYGEQKSMILF